MQFSPQRRRDAEECLLIFSPLRLRASAVRDMRVFSTASK